MKKITPQVELLLDMAFILDKKLKKRSKEELLRSALIKFIKQQREKIDLAKV